MHDDVAGSGLRQRRAQGVLDLPGAVHADAIAVFHAHNARDALVDAVQAVGQMAEGRHAAQGEQRGRHLARADIHHQLGLRSAQIQPRAHGGGGVGAHQRGLSSARVHGGSQQRVLLHRTREGRAGQHGSEALDAVQALRLPVEPAQQAIGIEIVLQHAVPEGSNHLHARAGASHDARGNIAAAQRRFPALAHGQPRCCFQRSALPEIRGAHIIRAQINTDIPAHTTILPILCSHYSIESGASLEQ